MGATLRVTTAVTSVLVGRWLALVGVGRRNFVLLDSAHRNGAHCFAMSYHGPYTGRLTSRRRAYTGPVRAGPRPSKLAFIATIVTIGFVAAAIAYDVGRTLRNTATGPQASTPR
jgi:hypothetical protein